MFFFETWFHIMSLVAGCTVMPALLATIFRERRPMTILGVDLAREFPDAAGVRTIGETVEILYQRRREADQKAIELLKSWLTPLQRQSVQFNNHFDVIGNQTGHRYRIHIGFSQFNITDMTRKKRLCAVPDPAKIQANGDIHLAQKIALECNEADTLSKANYADDPETLTWMILRP